MPLSKIRDRDRKRIERVAGFKPFEGTLNLEVNEAELKRFLGKFQEPFLVEMSGFFFIIKITKQKLMV